MKRKSRFTFSLRRLLLVPAIFATFFFCIPETEAAIFVFVCAGAWSVVLFLANKNNLDSIVLSALGSLLGGSLMLAEIHSNKYRPPTVLEKTFEISIGATCGYLCIKFLEHLVGKLIGHAKPNIDDVSQSNQNFIDLES